MAEDGALWVTELIKPSSHTPMYGPATPTPPQLTVSCALLPSESSAPQEQLALTAAPPASRAWLSDLTPCPLPALVAGPPLSSLYANADLPPGVDGSARSTATELCMRFAFPSAASHPALNTVQLPSGVRAAPAAAPVLAPGLELLTDPTRVRCAAYEALYAWSSKASVSPQPPQQPQQQQQQHEQQRQLALSA